MFIDEAVITIQGGKGGNGKVAFFPKRGGPCGGFGGAGGNVYFSASHNYINLNRFFKVREYAAGDGAPGEAFLRSGKNGKDLKLQVPENTTIIDLDKNTETVLTSNNSSLLICRGGKGGGGNEMFKTATLQTPRKFQVGFVGEKKRIKLILKLIADIGLIGLPNAGKSSLLNALTKAQAKVAAYPFTTLEPNLGELDGRIIADIPGLIEGASTGKGLGTKFLKHVEKVKLLLHCISSESIDLERDYQVVIDEMKKYNPVLLKKKQIILLTKTDLITSSEVKKKIKILEKIGMKVIALSIHDDKSLENLAEYLD
ncbi:Obg family GTPase CgtA [Candidatus Roizmanbacteria bacterium CG2_30_33_16]|uniref:Obg family GTPase CgtA n=1 Tax=Candidatus Roizmanbacteria bacterium CG2_30_33_16 TaxID=1805340 RepID=A0A1J5HKL9_9BACT|nr:MAG: Obg family GTPase CgtA [Candidatus Roizmanbacteria bacterium CG2_30_33_16]